jgi:hypothetical protein
VQFIVVASLSREVGCKEPVEFNYCSIYSHSSVLRCCILTSATVNSVSNFSWNRNLIKL